MTTDQVKAEITETIRELPSLGEKGMKIALAFSHMQELHTQQLISMKEMFDGMSVLVAKAYAKGYMDGKEGRPMDKPPISQN